MDWVLIFCFCSLLIQNCTCPKFLKFHNILCWCRNKGHESNNVTRSLIACAKEITKLSVWIKIFFLSPWQITFPGKSRSLQTSSRPWTATLWTSRPCAVQLSAREACWRTTCEEKFGPSSWMSMCLTFLPSLVSVYSYVSCFVSLVLTLLYIRHKNLFFLVSYNSPTASCHSVLTAKNIRKNHKDYNQVLLDVRRSMRRFPRGSVLPAFGLDNVTHLLSHDRVWWNVSELLCNWVVV